MHIFCTTGVLARSEQKQTSCGSMSDTQRREESMMSKQETRRDFKEKHNRKANTLSRLTRSTKTEQRILRDNGDYSLQKGETGKKTRGQPKRTLTKSSKDTQWCTTVVCGSFGTNSSATKSVVTYTADTLLVHSPWSGTAAKLHSPYMGMGRERWGGSLSLRERSSMSSSRLDPLRNTIS